MAGSNDLNLLLKAKVVKLKVELDAKGSNLPSQVNKISEMLKDKPVKLKVKLDAGIGDLNKQLSSISTMLQNNKSFKPMKIGIEIDVKGSATQIKKQLQDVNKIVDDFNKKYGKQLQQMQQQNQKVQQSIKNSNVNVPTGTSLGNFNNIKQYVSQLEKARDIMKQKFGSGLFSSFEMKDAKGNLQGFIATLEKANGVVQKVKYSWNAKKGQFEVIDRQTVTNTEKATKQAMENLRQLGREIDMLGKHGNKFRNEYNNMLSSKTTTKDAVNDLKTRIKDEQMSMMTNMKNNDLLIQQARLIRDIKNASLSVKDVSKRMDFAPLIQQARKASNSGDFANELKRVRLENDKLVDSISRVDKREKEYQDTLKQKLKLSQELRRLERTVVTNGNVSKVYMEETRAMLTTVNTAKQLEAVRKRIANIKQGKFNDGIDRQVAQSIDKTIEKLTRLKEIGGITESSFNRQMTLMQNASRQNLGDVNKQLDSVSKKLHETEEKMKASGKQIITLIDGARNSTQKTEAMKFKEVVNSNDISQIQKYIGELKKGKVSTIDMAETTDKLGRAVTEFKVKMEGSGKTVQSYTLQMEHANGTLRQTQQGLSYNANRNLGIFEQLKIAMARVPVWMASMTAFYGTLHTIQAMSREILIVDKSLTELKRVANSNINIDTLFKGAVSLSSELGNNVHDVMNAMNEFARTYGDFNERQLLAITRTAVLMSNVSDLTAEEATQTLVGTMNAFNITAEESIHIVDALNEVNEYQPPFTVM